MNEQLIYKCLKYIVKNSIHGFPKPEREDLMEELNKEIKEAQKNDF